jgi:hypothetical protein
MAGAIYDTTTLLSVMSHQKVLTPFWLGFFPQQVNFDTEDIAFDRVSADYRRLAPFVAPNVQGKVQAMRGYDTVSFKPAYVKPKDVVDPNMVIPRQPGEALGTGSLSLAQRRDAVIAEILKQHRTKLMNRNEWLAARAIIDGQVTITGEDYPAVTVNFRRHSTLSYTLAGTARWNKSAANPMLDIRTAKQNAFNRSGAKLTRLIFGATAWELFTAKVDLKEIMNRNYGGLDANITRMYDAYEGQEFLGYMQGSNGGGRIEAWIDTSKYVDEAGSEQFFLDQGTVVGASTAIEGVRCFGAIKDFDAQLQPLEVFSKMWRNEDPSVEYVLSQSAPLMVPKRPNASFKIKVNAVEQGD